MPVLHPRTPPPPDYYADNLRRLIAHVAAQYNDALTPAEHATAVSIRGSSVPALRLFARLLSRRGPQVRIDRLRYAEIPDVASALEELAATGLVSVNAAAPADTLLANQTLAELAVLFPRIPRERKATRIVQIVSRYPDHEIRRRLSAEYPWVEIARRDVIDTFHVLFFGDTHQDLTTLVLEDLGVLRFETYPLDPETRLFVQRAELDAYLALGRTRAFLASLVQQWNSGVAEVVLQHLWHAHPHRSVERRRSEQLNRLGALAEHALDTELALAAYRRASRPPSRERRARILARLGDPVGVERVLAEIRTAPATRAENDFATRFVPRKARLCVPLLSPRVEALRLAVPPVSRVETAALDALLERRGLGAHLENQFPLALFGLAFWDVVFAPVRGVFTNAYQLGPLDLFWSDFAATRADMIRQRLTELRDGCRLAARVLHTWDNKHGINNALVNWNAVTRPLVERAIAVVPVAAWLTLFDHLANNLKDARTGFPDLVLLYDDDAFEFVEVKGPGDQLRPEQRSWFRVFDDAAIPARVLKVTW